MEPLLLDAYWHRHLLFILQGKQQAAMDDLNFIIKKNKTHTGAYRSMWVSQVSLHDFTYYVSFLSKYMLHMNYSYNISWHCIKEFLNDS